MQPNAQKRKNNASGNHAFAWVAPAIFVIFVFFLGGGGPRSKALVFLWWVERKFVIFAGFVKAPSFWQGTKARFAKSTVFVTLSFMRAIAGKRSFRLSERWSKTQANAKVYWEPRTCHSENHRFWYPFGCQRTTQTSTEIACAPKLLVLKVPETCHFQNHLFSGPKKTMTATDVTGFDAIFSTGCFATFFRFKGARLTKLHIKTGGKAKNPVESLQWRRHPEIADFCPLSWSNLSWSFGTPLCAVEINQGAAKGGRQKELDHFFESRKLSRVQSEEQQCMETEEGKE